MTVAVDSLAWAASGRLIVGSEQKLSHSDFLDSLNDIFI